MYLNYSASKNSPSKLATIKSKDKQSIATSSSFLNSNNATYTAKEVLKEPEKWHNHKRSNTAPDLPVTKVIKSLSRQGSMRKSYKQKKCKKSAEAHSKFTPQVSSLLETDFNKLNESDRVKRIRVLAEKVMRVRVKC